MCKSLWEKFNEEYYRAKVEAYKRDVEMFDAVAIYKSMAEAQIRSLNTLGASATEQANSQVVSQYDKRIALIKASETFELLAGLPDETTLP